MAHSPERFDRPVHSSSPKETGTLSLARQGRPERRPITSSPAAVTCFSEALADGQLRNHLPSQAMVGGAPSHRDVGDARTRPKSRA